MIYTIYTIKLYNLFLKKNCIIHEHLQYILIIWDFFIHDTVRIVYYTINTDNYDL